MSKECAARRAPPEPVADRDDRRDGGHVPRTRAARRPPAGMRAGRWRNAATSRSWSSEVLRFLGEATTVIDATLGAGGHAEALLEAGVERVIGVDRDPAGDRARRVSARTVRRAFHRRADPVLTAARGEPGRRRPLRPRRELDAARPSRAGVLLPSGRAARHADGPRRRAGDGHREHGARGGARPDRVRVRRGATLAPGRGGDRAREVPVADRDHRRARGCGRERAGGAAGRPPPRPPDVPGAPHRGQPGAGGARPRPCLGRSRSSLPVAAWS